MTERKDMVVTVETRTEGGKGPSRRLRREGLVPAVVYGADKPPVPITVKEHDIKEILKQEGGSNTIFLLKLKGTSEERRAMIREIQSDPISGKFHHIDFIRITRGHKITVSMPVELEGDSVGVRNGGRVDFVTRDLEIELLPREIFDKLTVDISNLDIGESVRVGELEDQLPENARFLEDLERVVVLVEAPRKVEEIVPEEGLEEEEAVIEETEEPEVIKKGKGDEESE